MTDLEKAKGLLAKHTCVLCRGDTVYASGQAGISPMLDLLADGTALSGFSAADKIVGKAAALLFVLAGVKAVYGEVMSRGAQAVLSAHRIDCDCGTLVPFIINRQGTGICPMEQAVAQIEDPAAAFHALWETRNALRNAN